MIVKLIKDLGVLALFSTAIMASLPLQAGHHEKPEGNGTTEAAQLTLCTLNSGKTLKDAEKLIPSIREVHKEIGLDSFFGLMTPLFVSRQSTIDFIYADFVPFDELAGAWDEFMVSAAGAKLQAAINKTATCKKFYLPNQKYTVS